MSDGIGLAGPLLGLPGFRVVDVVETDVEVVVSVESTAARPFCGSCGLRAEAQDRVRVDIRDLACFGRPARLVWAKRGWRCREPLCPARTWTEHSDHVDAQAVITRRAGAEVCRQVGENARPVSQVADELGVCWWTVMNAVIEHGTPLVDDPGLVGPVHHLGVDETSFLKVNREHATVYATGLVDLQARIVIDMVEGNAAVDLRRWCANADPDGLRGSRWWPPIWPSRSAPAFRRIWSTPAVSLIHSMSWASRTAASTTCAGGCRTRHSAIEAASSTRCIGSANCYSPVRNDSTRPARNECSSACASAIPRRAPRRLAGQRIGA